jgi:hypothetical protein
MQNARSGQPGLHELRHPLPSAPRSLALGAFTRVAECRVSVGLVSVVWMISVSPVTLISCFSTSGLSSMSILIVWPAVTTTSRSSDDNPTLAAVNWYRPAGTDSRTYSPPWSVTATSGGFPRSSGVSVTLTPGITYFWSPGPMLKTSPCNLPVVSCARRLRAHTPSDSSAAIISASESKMAVLALIRNCR